MYGAFDWVWERGEEERGREGERRKRGGRRGKERGESELESE